MKRILFFVVAAVLLPTATASADLTVYEYVSGEKVTLDTVTGKYWYWNLNDFVNMTYGQQISAIGGISPTYGWIAGGWHMASLTEMNSLITYPGPLVVSSFRWPDPYPLSTLSMARYAYSSSSNVHSVVVVLSGSLYYSPLTWFVGDNFSMPNLGAWATTDATVVPAPPAVVLATTGLLTGLLCMLGAKLRGRWRYGPSSI